MGLGSIAVACLEHEFVTRIPNKDVMVVGCSQFLLLAVANHAGRGSYAPTKDSMTQIKANAALCGSQTCGLFKI